MLEIVRPRAELAGAYLRMCATTREHCEERYILHDPIGATEESVMRDFAAWERGESLPPGFVPHAVRFAVREGKLVGVVDIRLQLTDALRDWGGNLGIVVERGLWGRGIATEMIPAAVEAARSLCGEVLATCAVCNRAAVRAVRAAHPTETILGRCWRFKF